VGRGEVVVGNDAADGAEQVRREGREGGKEGREGGREGIGDSNPLCPFLEF
jgi:hypothetical protein